MLWVPENSDVELLSLQHNYYTLVPENSTGELCHCYYDYSMIEVLWYLKPVCHLRTHVPGLDSLDVHPQPRQAGSLPKDVLALADGEVCQ